MGVPETACPLESCPWPLVIVYGGPAGMAMAIRLRQLSTKHGKDSTVVVIEKCPEPDAHILFGAVIH